ncbi:MAG: hypothetical protein WC269_06525, partial [Candidatus Gracilibacteria bacterium]
MTPNGAYNTARELVYVRTGDINLAEEAAKACRFLAMIRRDYGSELFENFVSPRTSSRSRRKGTNEKGVSAMSSDQQELKQEAVVVGTEFKLPSLPL